MSTQYIVEKRNGNPAILQLNADGTYSTVAFGAGEGKVEDLLELVGYANVGVDVL